MRPLPVRSHAARQLRSTLNTQLTSSWICNSCKARSQPRARFSQSRSLREKPYYITTPIFYVNAAPHVGHLYTMVLTDILKRWQVLKGKKAILCTGTDEHGMKIQQAASLAGTPPKEFCDSTAEIFKTLAKAANISNDHFVRTTDEDHKDAVQFFWTNLEANGYIYQSKHEGWYCVSDETYYPENAIEKRLDPFTGRTFMASQETGKEVEWTSERNYHFRLSIFKDQLLDFYKENPEFVVPAARMADVVKQVEAGLEDLSISRPIERLSWGVRVPNDDSQTVYVWLDALINYITKAGYPWAPGQQNVLGWPADVQVIGKDIVRFHCIYWPAFLMALNIQPPKQILTHAHWTLGHQKMAKSTGNVVNPFFAIDRFGIDTMRFYLAHDGGILNDADYGNHNIADKYKKTLRGGLGNLVNRIFSPGKQVWKVNKIIKWESSIFPNHRTGALTVKLADKLSTVAKRASEQMEQLNPGAALHTIMDVVYEANKYMTAREPWNDVKRLNEIGETDPEVAKTLRERLECTIFHCAESVRIAGILLQPYMPTKAAELLDKIGVDESKRTYDYARLNMDSTYGVPIIRVNQDGKGPAMLFPPLPVDDAAIRQKELDAKEFAGAK